MRGHFRAIAIAVATLLSMPSAHAQEPSAVGLWQTIDDKTGQPRSLVRIIDNAGVFEGIVEDPMPQPDEDQNPRCTECRDARKDQFIKGMKIITGLTRNGLNYEGGRALDPEDGIIYRFRMRLAPDGRTMEVRGYVGISLFGRSQRWIRGQ